ncbi:MAG: hypothetical protein OYM47_20205 [Gemmatimonadota bacterium]|nr:hypothetical protein [Gemmatimonadota bacterium]
MLRKFKGDVAGAKSLFVRDGSVGNYSDVDSESHSPGPEWFHSGILEKGARVLEIRIQWIWRRKLRSFASVVDHRGAGPVTDEEIVRDA